MTLLAVSCAVAQLACARDLQLPPALEESAVAVITEGDAERGFTTRLDASDREGWVYFDFESGERLTPNDAGADADWELAFQRFHILSNGGVSGPGGVAVAPLAGARLADVTSAPADGYVADQPDSGADDDDVAESAFSDGDGWYAYDENTNRLSPRDIVYVVRTASGAHYELQMLGYYSSAGSSGHPSFTWAQLPAPSSTPAP